MLSTTPSTRASTVRRTSAALASCSRRVFPLRTTSRVPSTCAASTAASVTGSSGGVSMSTTSKRPDNSRSTSPMPRDPNSSLGLGGNGPLGRTSSRPPSSPHGSSTSSRSAAPISTDVRPAAVSIPRYSPNEGLRRSASTSTTLAPAWARAMARLHVVAVLPSADIELETMIIRGGVSTSTNRRFVRRWRNASDRADCASSAPIRG